MARPVSRFSNDPAIKNAIYIEWWAGRIADGRNDGMLVQVGDDLYPIADLVTRPRGGGGWDLCIIVPRTPTHFVPRDPA